jgi:hypothetical protein
MTERRPADHGAEAGQPDHLDDPVSKDWSRATSGEIAAEVLRVFPGSFITGSRWVDTAECPDD